MHKLSPNQWQLNQIQIKGLHLKLKLTLEETKGNLYKDSPCKGLGLKIKYNSMGKDKQDPMLLYSKSNNTLLILQDDYFIWGLHLFFMNIVKSLKSH